MNTIEILQILGIIYGFQLLILLGLLGVSRDIIDYEDRGDFIRHFIPFYWVYKIFSNIVYNIRNF